MWGVVVPLVLVEYNVSSYQELLHMDFSDILDPPILEFTGEFRFLSNFWYASFVFDNILWRSSEHAYQAQKSLDKAIKLRISKLATPSEAKRAGKYLACREDWDSVKYDLMYQIVLAKFTQNPSLRTQLINTGTKHLEEGNNHQDRIWGVCPPGSGKGSNHLGKTLMRVRTELW